MTYIQNLKPSLRAFIAHHKIPATYQEATDLARRIETNISLLQVGSPYQPVGQVHSNRQRLLSPMKREASPPQRGSEEYGGRRQRKQKKKERPQALEDRVQPPLPPPMPAPPRQSTAARQHPTPHTARRDEAPLPPLPRKEDGTIEWDKVQCLGCGKYGHTRKHCGQ